MRKTTSKSEERRLKVQHEAEQFTHIDRSNGTLLKERDLNLEKPHLSPVSGLATVEKLENPVPAN